MKTAFLFPGQGAQYVGMARDLVESYPQAAALFTRAGKVLGYDLLQICCEGPEEKLNSTVFSQPAIFAVSAALLDIVHSNAPALKPEVTAGLSMGEYTALYAAGLVSFEDTLRLVQKRGQAMQAAADRTQGAMVSLLGLDELKVIELCEEASGGELLVAVNFNCPGQIVVSGTAGACKRAEELAPKYGAMKAVPLSVAGAFHTEMMDPAARELAAALEGCNIANPGSVKVIANISGEYYLSGDDIRQGLVKQLVRPILWQKCMERLISEGVEEFYEIGPGRVLTGLMKRISRRTKITNISTADSLKEFLKSNS